jgi:hypothetical protein
MDGALTGLINGIKNVLSRKGRSVSAEPTQGCAYMNHHVLIMKNSEHTPGQSYKQKRSGKVDLKTFGLQKKGHGPQRKGGVGICQS